MKPKNIKLGVTIFDCCNSSITVVNCSYREQKETN